MCKVLYLMEAVLEINARATQSVPFYVEALLKLQSMYLDMDPPAYAFHG